MTWIWALLTLLCPVLAVMSGLTFMSLASRRARYLMPQERRRHDAWVAAGLAVIMAASFVGVFICANLAT